VVLSRERADVVKGDLHDIQQIPRTQMFTVGYAAEHPIASNNTEEGRLHNRRVDIVMVNQLPPGVGGDLAGGTASAEE
jgi:outer membrane protein OmpA-like peptidoglycan-associated protein